MAVTAEGIPVRCWTFPGTTSGQVIIKKIKDDLADWSLHWVVRVADCGFNSAANRGYLQKGGGHHIVAERVRGGSAEARAALARAGRYHAAALVVSPTPTCEAVRVSAWTPWVVVA
jgi:hypothetical protein